MAPLPPDAGPVRDRRGGGIAGTVSALLHTGEPVLVVGACSRLRARHLAPILGGVRLCSHAALLADPTLGDGGHVVIVDPPATPAAAVDLLAPRTGRMVHLAWGEPEVDFSLRIHEREHGLRGPLSEIYRALRNMNPPTPVAEEQIEEALRGDPRAPRTASAAGRALRVLVELDLVHLDREARRITVPSAQRTSLELSAWYRNEQFILDEGRLWLTRLKSQAACGSSYRVWL